WRGQDRFGLGVLGAAILGQPGFAAMIAHHAMLYADLRDPVALLRGSSDATTIGQLWPYAGSGAPAALSAAQVAEYSALMAASQPHVAAEVLAAWPIGR